MLYELRHYTPKPGHEAALTARFRDHVLPIMKRHGLRVHDFWESADGSGQLWYVMAWQDEEESIRLWATFRSDPAWLAARAVMDTDGVPMQTTSSVFLRRVPYFKPQK